MCSKIDVELILKYLRSSATSFRGKLNRIKVIEITVVLVGHVTTS